MAIAALFSGVLNAHGKFIVSAAYPTILNLVMLAVVLPPITLSSGQPLADEPYELEAGKYYRLAIEADGFARCKATVDMNIGMMNFMQNGPRVPAVFLNE